MSSKNKHLICFAKESHPPVFVPEGVTLSENLDINNSPMLFGCRTGICGTCLIEVEEGLESLPKPDEEEQEVLDLYAPNNKKARLACQLPIQSTIKIRYLGLC